MNFQYPLVVLICFIKGVIRNIFLMNSPSLDEILSKQDDLPDLSVVVHHREFSLFLSKGNKKLIKYIILNFDKILEFIFEKTYKDPNEVIPYLAILLTRNSDLKNEILTSTKFVNYITEYPRRVKIYHLPSMPIFFDYLQHFICNDTELLPYFANRDFFESILQVCDFKKAYEFMETMLTSKYKSFRIFFEQIDIASILAEHVIGTTFINFSIIELFEIISDSFSRQCASAVVQNDLITKLFDAGFNEVCYQMIDFIDFLYEKSFQHTKESMWNTIQFLVEDRIPEMCDFILNQKGFTIICRSSSSLLLTYISEKETIFPKLQKVIEKLVNEVFEYPTNSFLHNIVFDFLSSLRIIPSIFNEIVTHTDLCKKIVDMYDKREEGIAACYWGQLRQISELITIPHNVSQNQWNNIVQTNSKNEKIISAPVKNMRGIRGPKAKQIAQPEKSSSNILAFSYTNIIAVIVVCLTVVLLYLNRS